MLETIQLSEKQAGKMQRYYTFHSRIYDSTRWTFLFGRNELIRRLPFPKNGVFNVLEVGCGTGHNLANLHRAFPHAQLTGIDVSEDMLNIAKQKTARFSNSVRLINEPYGENLQWGKSFDLIIFSYSLSMINPHWPQLVDQALLDLQEGGTIAVADFHHSRFEGFRKWMGVNHVKMEGHLHPYLSERFAPQISEIKQAYSGVWEYFLFVGKKASG
jgi:S-adenosylmethionine-diacylgycerolhomoserine-N-methlytransferase